MALRTALSATARFVLGGNGWGRSMFPRGELLLLPILVTLLATGCVPVLEVDRFDDEPSATACTSAPLDCSLRGAITHATATSGRIEIQLEAGVYALGIAGAEEDSNQTGDLDVTGIVDVRGAGMEATLLHGNGFDRVLDVDPAALGASVTLYDLTIQDGSTTEDWGGGGGLRNRGTLALWNVRVRDNGVQHSSATGGGILNLGTVELHRCQIVGNSAPSAAGGGLANGLSTALPSPAGTATLAETTIDANSALWGGGGVFNPPGAILTIENSIVRSNTLDSSQAIEGFSIGGGILNNGTLVMLNSTISGNVVVAQDWGGAFGGGVLQDLGSSTLTHVTIADNSVSTVPPGGPQGGSGIAVGNGDALVGNSVIANDCVILSALGGVDSQGGNVESPGHTCHLFQPTDLVNVLNAGLTPLGANGGPTLTHALQRTSPAVDHGVAGLCPATDQRGFARTDGACDAGAYETNAVP